MDQPLLDNKINTLQSQLANLPRTYPTKPQLKGFNVTAVEIHLSCLPFLVEAVLPFTLL